jgi:hypothetical protein
MQNTHFSAYSFNVLAYQPTVLGQYYINLLPSNCLESWNMIILDGFEVSSLYSRIIVVCFRVHLIGPPPVS